MRDPFETIPNELLAEAHGGRSTLNELVSFARQYGFVITCTTGGKHAGSAHRQGRAIDLRTRDKSTAYVNRFIRIARANGYRVSDERYGGNKYWTAPHIHLQK